MVQQAATGSAYVTSVLLAGLHSPGSWMIHSKRRTVFSTVVVSLRNDDGVISGISLSSVLALFPTAMLKAGNAAWTWNLAQSVVAQYIRPRIKGQSGSVP